jgi:hypothetical protein
MNAAGAPVIAQNRQLCEWRPKMLPPSPGFQSPAGRFNPL